MKAKWADAWTTISGLYCDWFKLTVSPDVAEAQLTRSFGSVMFAGTEAHVPAEPQDIVDYYVKVTLSQHVGLEADPAASAITWYGVIVESQHDRQGLLDTGEITGKQILVCRGLEYLLQRTTIDSSFVKTSAGEQEIGRAIAFNLGGGDEAARFRQANRHTAWGAQGAYIFAQKLDEGSCEQWSSADIADYLLTYHAPLDKNAIEKIPFAMDAGFSTSVLSKFYPTMKAQGKTLKQCLDELIDRRRGLCWGLIVQTVLLVETPTIVVYNFNKDILVLPSGAVIPPNPSQGMWLLDNEQLVETHILGIDTSTKFDRAVACGERLGGCFTISNGTTSLEADYESALVTAYEAAASGDAGYAALDDYAKLNANDHYRRSDKFLKVFRYFRVPPTWAGTISGNKTCPNPDDPAGAQTLFWIPGLRFQNHLPLLSETDYSNLASITSDTLADSKAEYLRPFALIYESSTQRYYPLDKMSLGEDLAGDLPQSAGREWSANLRMQDDALGIIVDVHGYPQHAIASSDFTPADTVDELQGYAADLRWQDIHATVFCEFDQRLEAKWPTAAIVEDPDTLKEVRIEVPNARLDYVCTGTLIGVSAAGSALSSAGGYVRDDREFLQDVARSAFQWYGATRKSVSVTMESLVQEVALGTLITHVGNLGNLIEVNTLVTQQVFDLLADTLTTTTNFAELDFTARQ